MTFLILYSMQLPPKKCNFTQCFKMNCFHPNISQLVRRLRYSYFCKFGWLNGFSILYSYKSILQSNNWPDSIETMLLRNIWNPFLKTKLRRMLQNFALAMCLIPVRDSKTENTFVMKMTYRYFNVVRQSHIFRRQNHGESYQNHCSTNEQ